MGRLRSLRNFLVALSLSLCALLFLTLLASHIEQHLFRRRAERLLSELQSLELRKTPWQEAQAKLRHWGKNLQFDEHCNSQKCSEQITLNDFVCDSLAGRNLFVKLDDYLRWRLKLSYSEGPFVRAEFWLLRRYMRAGGHPAIVIADIGMRDGIVWSKGISVNIYTYSRFPKDVSDRLWEFTLIADVHSVPRFRYFGSADTQLTLHPNYRIGRPNACTPCVRGWANFTPYADAAVAHRLMQLDLSCLTRWRSCTTQNDIMPSAWAEYLADSQRLNSSKGDVACSPSYLETLGRDSANIAVVEILKYQDETDWQGQHYLRPRVRILDPLKGVDWKIGETAEVSTWLSRPDAKAVPRVGSKVYMFGGQARTASTLLDPGDVCLNIPVSENTLTILRRGMAQDYTALDKPE